MNHKKLVCTFLSSFIGSICLIEILFTFYPIATSRSEMRIHGLQKINHKFFDHAVFGSSVTHDSLGTQDLLTPEFYNGSTVVAMTIAGQYFLLREFFEAKNSAKEVFISFIPIMLTEAFLNIQNQAHPSFRYFRDVFHEKYGKEIIRDFPSYSHESSYFRSRKFYIKELLNKLRGKYYYHNRPRPKYKSKKTGVTIINRRLNKPKPQREITKRLASMISKVTKRVSYQSGSISNEAQYYHQKIAELTKANGTKLYFIVEPMPTSRYTLFSSSKLKEQITSFSKKHDVSLIIANKVFNFEDRFFNDGYHLHQSYGLYYEEIFYKIFLRMSSK